MSLTEQSSQQTTAKEGWFKMTQWSVVVLAGQGQSAPADAALAKLCQTYWYPLYVFVRRQGHSQETHKTWCRHFLRESWRKIISRMQNATKESFAHSS